MKKLVLLSGSILLFIILSVVAFNFGGDTSGKVTDTSKSAVKDTPVVEKTDTSASRDDSTPTEQIPTIAPMTDKQAMQSGNVIEDIRVQYKDNGVLVTWKVPQATDIQNLRLIRTPSYPEGLMATYDVINAGGNYLDSTVKTGGRYYYELQGKTSKNDIYSKMVSIEVPGSIILTVNDPLFTINGKQAQYSPLKAVKPFVMNGKIMIPAKSVIDNLDGLADWVKGQKSKALTDVLIKYRKYEIEMFAGKSEIIVNRVKKKIDYVPVVRDTVFYVSLNMLQEYLDCRIQLEGNTVMIEKVIDPITATNKGNYAEQEIQIKEGAEFEISLDDLNQDGKSWYNAESGVEGIVLKEKRLGEKDKSTSLYILRLSVTGKGEHDIIFRYFNPKIGETSSDRVRKYKITGL